MATEEKTFDCASGKRTPLMVDVNTSVASEQM